MLIWKLDRGSPFIIGPGLPFYDAFSPHVPKPPRVTSDSLPGGTPPGRVIWLSVHLGLGLAWFPPRAGLPQGALTE
jgi:hypothetical protein